MERQRTVKQKRVKLVEMGRTGLTRFGGYISEEWLSELSGSKGAEVYRKMADGDDIIGGYLFAIKQLAKSVPWFAVPGDSSQEGQEAAKFLESCIYDMSFSWPDTLDEILSMLPFGWAYFEQVFKIRRGPREKSPKFKSQYSDGRIGWAKWAPRAQESLNEWIYDEEADQLLGLSQIPAPDYKERRIPLSKALHFVTTSAKANPEGRSILRNAYRPWYMKTNIEDLEGIGIERDLAGYPTLYVPLEVFNRETEEAEAAYNDFVKVITDVRRDVAEGIMLPAVFDSNGNRLYEFKLLSSSGVRQFDTSRVITRYVTHMALTVMADFILLGQQRQGSYALSETKAKMFYQALSAILDNIAETINSQAVPLLFELNGWELEELPYLAHGKVEPISLATLSEFLKVLKELGVQIDDRLENHLRGIADLPLREVQDTQRGEGQPASSVQNPQQGETPELDEGGEEVAA
jgi:hypothetical protein